MALLGITGAACLACWAFLPGQSLSNGKAIREIEATHLADFLQKVSAAQVAALATDGSVTLVDARLPKSVRKQ
jgi:hypothetical protein